jgi:hypothetical protein
LAGSVQLTVASPVLESVVDLTIAATPVGAPGAVATVVTAIAALSALLELTYVPLSAVTVKV